MQHVFRWRDLISEARKQFPEINPDILLFAEDDMGELVREIASAHELTLTEAAQMVAWRLPDYLPEESEVRLSA